MDDPVDLTYDSDEVRLQAAVEASLNPTRSGANAGSSSGGGSFSSTATAVPTKRQMSQQSDPERHDHESRTHGKRKRRITLEGKELCARPPLFRLMASPTDTLSVGSVGLADILSGDFHEALLTNYMVDSQILMDAQPRLRHVPWVLVCGDMDNM